MCLNVNSSAAVDTMHFNSVFTCVHLIGYQLSDAMSACDGSTVVTRKKSFDIGSTDPFVSPTAINRWLETDVFQLRKHCAALRPSSVCKLIQLKFLLFFCFYLFAVGLMKIIRVES
jgi:hypothetical protein